MATKTIEVELSIDFGWTDEGSAGVSKWIPFVDLSVKGSGSKKSLHKIKLTLEIDTQGDPSKGRGWRSKSRVLRACPIDRHQCRD